MLQENDVEQWQIFVKMLNGYSKTITTQPSATVRKVMDKLNEYEPLKLRLIFGGKQLEPDRLLAEYGIQKGSTLHAVLRLAGGDESPSRQRI